MAVVLTVEAVLAFGAVLGVAPVGALEVTLLPAAGARRNPGERIERTLFSCLSRAFLKLRISDVFGSASVYRARSAVSCASTAASCVRNWLSAAAAQSCP